MFDKQTGRLTPPRIPMLRTYLDNIRRRQRVSPKTQDQLRDEIKLALSVVQQTAPEQVAALFAELVLELDSIAKCARCSKYRSEHQQSRYCFFNDLVCPVCHAVQIGSYDELSNRTDREKETGWYEPPSPSGSPLG